MFSVILLLKLFVKPVLSYLIEAFGPGYFHQHVDFMDNLMESDFLLFLFENNFFIGEEQITITNDYSFISFISFTGAPQSSTISRGIDFV